MACASVPQNSARYTIVRIVLEIKHTLYLQQPGGPPCRYAAEASDVGSVPVG